MDISQQLQRAIEKQTKAYAHSSLVKDAKNISERYRDNKGQGKKLLTTNSEATAYALSRMPATYGAVMDAMKYSFDLVDFTPKSMIDAGAGTGTATWALEEMFGLDSYTCLEREDAMMSIGQSIMEEDKVIDGKTTWKKCDLIRDKIDEKADLVIASYVLNELTQSDRLRVADKLWESTEKMFTIIGPGTPKGFNNLLKVRDHIVAKGGKLVGPCPNDKECPASKIEDEWCHFSCRINRSKLHKQLKAGDSPFEDEKYMFFSFLKEDIGFKNVDARIVRHPKIYSGYVELEVCTDGKLTDQRVTKKDKEYYKIARKSKAGDSFSKVR